MKKILLLLFMLPIFVACSSETEDVLPEEEPVEKVVDITGVWVNGNYFVSFSPSGYYTAYIGRDFIDCGNYTLNKEGNTVKVKNFYFDRETEINVNVSQNKITCIFKYINVLGESLSNNIVFEKTAESPQEENNVLVGKTCLDLYIWGRCEWKFISGYAATFSTPDLKPKVRNHFYIYRPPYMYTQYFKPKGASLSDFYKDSDKGKVFVHEITIENGNIIDIY